MLVAIATLRVVLYANDLIIIIIIYLLKITIKVDSNRASEDKKAHSALTSASNNKPREQ